MHKEDGWHGEPEIAMNKAEIHLLKYADADQANLSR